MPWVDEAQFLTFCHHDCIHNQLLAVANRVMGVVPRPSKDGLARLYVAADWVASQLPLCYPEDYYVMPNRYGGSKRTRYLQATDEVLAFGLSARDASIKMFVKCEKLEPDPDKPNPDPRAIQFRNAKYCVELARYLKPIEEHLYLLSGVSRGVKPTRCIAKGLNQVERAELLVEKLGAFTDPVVLSLDASRFDKHVDVELLKVEHRVYTLLCFCAYFAWLLTLQLKNSCTSSRGLKYKVLGKRMSGDMNTALGNCLLMVIFLVAFMWWCSKWDVLDDGDDVLLLVERRDLPRVMRSVKPDFLEFGMEMKVEKVTDDLHQIVFCQSQVIEFTPGRFKFTRNPWKVLSCALAGTKYFTQPGARPKLLFSIGLCELILNLGVPILQEFALAVLRNCGASRGLELAPDGSLMSRVRREMRVLGLKTLERVDPQPIADCARVSFARAFGTEPFRQVQIERWLSTWSFGLEGMCEFPEEWDVPRWEFNPVDLPEVYLPSEGNDQIINQESPAHRQPAGC